MNTPKQDIELFLRRVEEMRKTQKEFDKHKNSVTLKEKREKEALVDAAITVMRRKGYDPDQFKKTIEQKDLFK